ncbi:hypothetical protein HNY73_001164 [Argiope bruennichi]|uniref:Gustatory receptor n=1 Tax=Argiope bruennichi TaxID=94029 RepID=A0A8T0G302_ARGBR|nr:hypothetical protein HNY73_001164 [Argiope bruennichi]
MMKTNPSLGKNNSQKHVNKELTTFRFTQSIRNVVMASESPKISLSKMLLPLLTCFHFFGVETLHHHASSRKNQFCYWIWKCPKYVMSILLLFSVFSQTLSMLVAPDKKIEMAGLFVILIKTSAHISMRKARRQFQIILKELSHISDSLHSSANYKKIKGFFRACSAFGITMLISFYVTFQYSFSRKKMEQIALNASFVFNLLNFPPKYYELNYDIMFLIYPIVFGIPITLLAAYYCFVCGYLKSLLDELVLQLRDQFVEHQYQLLLEVYDRIINLMNTLDTHFSYPVFVAVSSSMAAHFWVGCNMVFTPKINYESYLFPLTFAIFYLFLSQSIMLPASTVNVAAKLAKDEVKALLGRVPSRYEELKIRLAVYQSISTLTLWKIYDIDKSLNVSIFGTVITYGILIATLKISQDAKN